jgi:uncharacterized membrane protein
MSKGRLEAFSDGVIAIIITIMVLEMKVPHGTDLQALRPLLPILLTYVLSFIYIGIYWNNHHHMLHAARHVSGGVLWANLHLLFWLSLIPFVTGWLGENHGGAWPTALYGVVLLMAGCAYEILQWTLVVCHGREGTLAQAVGRDVKGKLSLAVYGVAIALAFANQWVSDVLYVAVALAWFIPDRRIEQEVRVQAAGSGKSLPILGLVILGSISVVPPARGAVICQKRSGVVVSRLACRPRETALDLAQLGALGPKGDKGDPGDTGNAGTPGPRRSCAPDSVLVGTTCVDAYEASVWSISPVNTTLVAKVQAGTASLADLTGGGAVQLGGEACLPAYPVTFPRDGNWTPVVGSSPPSPGIYAASIPGVVPSACISWLQANQACLLSRKRLLKNVEWQGAAAGTPDPGGMAGPNDCNLDAPGTSATGIRANCRSLWGAFDLVGNLEEWVAEWAENPVACTDWMSATGFSNGDQSCVGGAGGPGGTADFKSIPHPFARGGRWLDVTFPGVFSVRSIGPPHTTVNPLAGFRCAR